MRMGKYLKLVSPPMVWVRVGWATSIVSIMMLAVSRTWILPVPTTGGETNVRRRGESGATFWASGAGEKVEAWAQTVIGTVQRKSDMMRGRLKKRIRINSPDVFRESMPY